MMSLFLDTSNFKLIVAVVDEDNNIIKTVYNEEIYNDLSIKILDIVKKCIDESEIRPDDIDKIYIVNGPGSFTGVRIGVTVAKTFAWAKKKIIIPISSLEVLASTKVNTKYVAAMIDARRDCVFSGIYDNNLNPILEDSYISLESLKNNIPDDDCTYISDDNINYFQNVIKADVDILRIINKHKNDVGVNPHSLNPKYLKMTEAEANLISKGEND